jgi:DNA-binding transcriptional regulator YiaG
MTPGQFKKVRKRLGLTQAELAHILDVKMNTVYRWEAGILPISRVVELAVGSLQPVKKHSKNPKRNPTVSKPRSQKV